MIRDELLNVPATTNPLGVKGVGEAGTTASIAAVMNAVADAIPGRRRRASRHAGHRGATVGSLPTSKAVGGDKTSH